MKAGLIRMLTPKGLGQSLREIADNTLTSLKLGGSAKDGRGGGVASGSSSGERPGGVLNIRVGESIMQHVLSFGNAEDFYLGVAWKMLPMKGVALKDSSSQIPSHVENMF